MSGASRRVWFCVCVCLLAIASFAQNQSSQPVPNSDPTYQQLRSLSLGGEVFSIANFDLKRDAATFHLRSGTICFVPPVQGKVTGAVFVGDGNMVLEPPLAGERRMLRLLTKENEFSENFSQLILRFTDATYDEIKKTGQSGGGACDANLLKDTQNALRHNRILKYNLDGRILQDVLGTEPGCLFVAFIKGKRYSDKLVYAIDPHGALPLVFPGLAPEEVQLATYDESKLGVWASFHFSDEYKNGKATGSQRNAVIQIDHQQLDTTVEKSANLLGKATTTFESQVNGLRVVPFSLFRTLRVQNVVTADGKQLSFIQEDKNDDAEFFVILDKPLGLGEKLIITTSYGGKDAVSNEGGGNYFPVARDDWYPNSPSSTLGDYSTYDLTFHIPKGMKVAATGSLVSESNEGNQNVTVWKSEGPQTVAGFNFGRFKVQEAKMEKPDVLVQSYANEDPPDSIKALLHVVNNELPSIEHGNPSVALGNMSTVPLIKKALAEGQVAMQLYSEYFGALPIKRLAMTQQTSCSFGQAWPSLVWLPMCSFYDSTIRHQLGLDDDRGYWKSVAPHEVAHQWWGHQIGFNSYRDQWMSEGFASMSSSLFLQLVEKDHKKFIQFWNDERDLLTERNKEGFRAIDVGPVTMGYRLSNSRSGSIATRLIYPKGAYILHMVRMMMWDPRTGDQNFKAAMQDFVGTYAGKAATTEDFKSILEKHMTQDMATIGGGNMDWFFNEYVYGTALPSYKFEHSFDTAPDGKTVFNFKLTQSDVDDTFRMLVPVYFELNDGRIITLGRIKIAGNNTVSQQVPMSGLKEKPKRALINYMNDVLASN